MRPETLEFLTTVVNTPSPSGYEQDVAALFKTYISPYADRISTDVLGNVIAVLNPDAATKVMLAGHMDEIGFIVHFISEDGFLHFSAVGGNDAAVPLGQRVWVHGKKTVAGVVGSKAMHLMSPAETSEKPALKDLWIDIGATSRAEAEDVVALGDVVTLQGELVPLLGDRAVARAFDNKAGMVIVAETLRILKEEAGLNENVGVYAVATVQEEIGSRGAQTAAFQIEPQCGLVVDMGQATDYPNLRPANYGSLIVGAGPAISRGANTNHVMFQMLVDAASTNGIPFQVSVTPGTSPTDARVLQVNKTGMASALLEVPLRYMHTPCEVLSLKDIENCAHLMAAFCRQLKPQANFTPHKSRMDRPGS